MPSISSGEVMHYEVYYIGMIRTLCMDDWSLETVVKLG